jgi:WD40-like Beta Propeller Repeat
MHCPTNFRAGGGSDKSSLYMVSIRGGAPRRICQGCASYGPKGFSSDGSRILAQHYLWDSNTDQVELINVVTSEVKLVLSHPKNSLWRPYYSWDDKWMTFKMEIPQSSNTVEHFGIYITPVENFIPAGQSHWIALTPGDYWDDKPQLSADGNTLYFTSNRDGHNCF